MSAIRLPAGLRRMLPVDVPPQPASGRLVHLCAWCEPQRRRAREAAAHALDCAVSHGICPTHAAEMRAEAAAMAAAAPSGARSSG